MTDHLAQLPPGNSLDELVDQLLECGGVLSQIVGHMVRAEASGLSSPDAAPIPEVAHDVIRDAVSEKMARYGAADLTAAARVVQDATSAICENVFLVPAAEIGWPPGQNGSRPALNRRARRQRGRGNRR